MRSSRSARYLKQLSGLTTIPNAFDERLARDENCKPFLEQGIVDVLQPDIAYAGGISEAKKDYHMAEEYDVQVYHSQGAYLTLKAVFF